MTNFCLADHRDNFYQNYRLQTSTRPWWFYFCQIRFLSLLPKEAAFSGAKEQLSPCCCELVIRATNTSEGRPLPQMQYMRGTGFAPRFCYYWLVLESMLAANPAIRQLLQGSEGTLILSLRISPLSRTLLSSLCYLLCGIGDEKTWEREKAME